jgi:adenylate kinase family enzyme
MHTQPFIFIGRAGAGKGTQAKLLIEFLGKKDPAHPVLYVETGAEFRKYIQGESYTAKLGKGIIESGGLMPEFMPVYMWGKLIAENYSGKEHLVFDGTPRKLLEAKLLDSLFPFYSLGKPLVIYLDIDHSHSSERLSLRAKSSGRRDDGAEVIEHRRTAFERDVVPTIEWYRTNPNVSFLDINGRGTIEDIHKDIVKRTGLA